MGESITVSAGFLSAAGCVRCDGRPARSVKAIGSPVLDDASLCRPCWLELYDIRVPQANDVTREEWGTYWDLGG